MNLSEAPTSAPNLQIPAAPPASSGGTRELLKTEIEPLVARVLYHDANQGKGAALRNGIRAATGDMVIIQDADRALRSLIGKNLVALARKI